MARYSDGRFLVTPRTLVAVHAHPDDEAIFTAGATLWAQAQGHRTVLITCTNGRLGIDPQGRGGDVAGHDSKATRLTRAAELIVAAEAAGIDRLITLDYDDSGMAGWQGSDAPSVFASQSVASVAERIASFLREESADVVLTYDPNGFYGHPDHIMTHRATMAAVEEAATVQRVYYPVLPHHVVSLARELGESHGIAVPAWVRDARGVPDGDIDVTLPTASFSPRKQRSIALHASQVDNAEIVGLEPLRFESLFGTEYYQRGWSRGEVTGDQNDLFGGMK